MNLAGDDLAALATAAAARTAASGDAQGDFTNLLDAQRAAHPQLEAQRQRIAALQAQRTATRAEGSPTLSLTGQTGPAWSRNHGATAPGSEPGGSRWSNELGLRWSMTFADGGARDARLAQSEALLDAGRAQLALLERNLADNLWQRHANAQDADAALAASDVAWQAARAAEQAALGRYQAGVGTLTDLLSAQADVAQRARQRSQAEQQRLRSRAGLLHALGSPLLSNLSPLP
jgi:outer membrane protein